MNVAIIPARGGSKGVPGKNVRKINGKPLIAYSVEQAIAAKSIERVFVSTDDLEIAEIAREYGAEIITRPETISGDTASSEAALEHALAWIRQRVGEPGLIFFLQCTSPIREASHLDSACRLLIEKGADSLLTVSPSHSFLWQRDEVGCVRAVNYDYMNRPRRQDMELQYKENGSFYIFKPEVLDRFGNRLGGKIELFEMPEKCAYEIDSFVDFAIIETLIKSA
jgi:CMP-N,N'-diacetyllegionaminic acid synthase